MAFAKGMRQAAAVQRRFQEGMGNFAGPGRPKERGGSIRGILTECGRRGVVIAEPTFPGAVERGMNPERLLRRVAPTGNAPLRLDTSQRDMFVRSPDLPRGLRHALHKAPVRDGKLSVRVTRAELEALIVAAANAPAEGKREERERPRCCAIWKAGRTVSRHRRTGMLTTASAARSPTRREETKNAPSSRGRVEQKHAARRAKRLRGFLTWRTGSCGDPRAGRRSRAAGCARR